MSVFLFAELGLVQSCTFSSACPGIPAPRSRTPRRTAFLAGFRLTGILLFYVSPVPCITSLSFSDLHCCVDTRPLALLSVHHSCLQLPGICILIMNSLSDVPLVLPLDSWEVSRWVCVCSVGHLDSHISCSKAVRPPCLIRPPLPQLPLPLLLGHKVIVCWGERFESEQTQGYSVSDRLYFPNLRDGVPAHWSD